MPGFNVTTTESDVKLIDVPWDKVYVIKSVIISNRGEGTATVRLKDVYTYSLGPSSGTSGSRDLLVLDLPVLPIGAGSAVVINNIEGEEVIGELDINTDQPVYVYVDIVERGING